MLLRVSQIPTGPSGTDTGVHVLSRLGLAICLQPWRTVLSEIRAALDRRRDVGGGQLDIFRLLVESIKDYAIFILDPEGNILTWNPGAQAMKGYTKDEVVGQHFSKFYPAEAIESGWPQRELALAL